MNIFPLDNIPKELKETQTEMRSSELSNPLINQKELIPFDQIKPHHFISAFEILIDKIEPELKMIEHHPNPSWETTLIPIEKIEEEIHQIIGPMIHLKMVMDSYHLRQAWREIEPTWTQLDLRIKQSNLLFKAYLEIKKSEEWNTFSQAQKRVLNRRLLEAKLNGVELKREEKKTFNQLISKLNKLQFQYQANILDAIKDFSLILYDKEQIEGIPDHVLELASHAYQSSEKPSYPASHPKSGPWKLTLTPPIYLPVMRHCKNRQVRETLYRAQIIKSSTGRCDNSENLKSQLILRKKIANLLEFDSYAKLSLTKKMAPNVDYVKSFLHDLRHIAWEFGLRDLEEIKTFARQSTFNDPLMPWDLLYWAERLREEKFHLSEEKLKEYFPFPHVLSGLFDLCHTLFGITIQPADFNVPVWHSDVSYYVIQNQEGNQIASFYLDPYSRPETKRGGAWMESCRNRFISGDLRQLPVAYIVCNATPPINSSPALLSFSEVQTLFHEFGHALQHLLTEMNYPSISGTNGIEWDAVEVVSQFMENWCYHPPSLKKITSHLVTHAPISDELIHKIIASRNYQSGLKMLTQIKYSLIDLELHDQFDPESEVSPFKLWHDICQYTSHLPCLEEDRFLCSFHHIFGSHGYAAGYYSYKWAEILSADAFSAFEEVGLENELAIREIGEKFKKTFLQLGGALHPIEVFKLFRGRKPSIDSLLRHNKLYTQDDSK